MPHSNPDDLAVQKIQPQAAFGFLFNTVGKFIDREVASAIKPLGLEPRMLGILSIVEKAPNLTQKDYAQILLNDVNTFGRLVDKLEEKSLINRSEMSDRRAKKLSLTENGAKTLREAKSLAQDIEKSIMRVISEDAQSELRAIIGEIIQGMRQENKLKT